MARSMPKILSELNRHWPKDLILFAWSGMLCLVHAPTGKVIESYGNILCDGGDPDSEEIDGDTYISHYKK